MVATSEILHVYSSNLAQWIIDICQIQNQWKHEKYIDPIHNVTHYVMWTFWSKIAFGLQIIHQNRFNIHLAPPILVFVCLYQSINISRSARIHLCPHIYITDERLKNRIDCICWYNNQCVTWTQKIRNNPSKYTLRTCDIERQSVCLHLVKVLPETRPWSTGRGLSLMHTYEQCVAFLVRYISEGPTGVSICLTSIQVETTAI